MPSININVTKDGRIMNMGNTFVPDVDDVIPDTPTRFLRQLDAASLGKLDYLDLKARATLLGCRRRPAGYLKRQSLARPGYRKMTYRCIWSTTPNRMGIVALVWALEIYTTDSLHYWQIERSMRITGEVDS